MGLIYEYYLDYYGALIITRLAYVVLISGPLILLYAAYKREVNKEDD